MSSYIQVVSFFVSFVYGIIFYYVSFFNKGLICNKSIVKQFVVNLIFILDVVLIYIYVMYKINQGNIHVYYITLVVVGYWVGYKSLNKCKNIVNKIKSRRNNS